ncbi:hypothetical protein SFRURICE_002364 [Spodoptera frugiperda]|nr:hypothetical protein SFRURICE_002364 [Spodoptera frugiperda]
MRYVAALATPSIGAPKVRRAPARVATMLPFSRAPIPRALTARSVNAAFEELRIRARAGSGRLPKLEILRAAIQHIERLQAALRAAAVLESESCKSYMESPVTSQRTYETRDLKTEKEKPFLSNDTSSCGVNSLARVNYCPISGMPPNTRYDDTLFIPEGVGRGAHYGTCLANLNVISSDVPNGGGELCTRRWAWLGTGDAPPITKYLKLWVCGQNQTACVRHVVFRARLKEPSDHHRWDPVGVMQTRSCGLPSEPLGLQLEKQEKERGGFYLIKREALKNACDEYRKLLNERTRELLEDEEWKIEEFWKELKDAVIAVATQVCGVSKRKNPGSKRNEWWDDEVKEVIEQKKKAWLDLLASKANRRMLDISKKKKEYKEKIERKFSQNFRADAKLFWHLVRTARGKVGDSKVGMIRDRNGSVIGEKYSIIFMTISHKTGLAV